MSKLNTRLAALEKQAQPVKEFVIIDTDGERYWTVNNNDYRQTIGGEGCTFLTQAEVKELERTHTVIMVEYVVDWRIPA